MARRPEPEPILSRDQLAEFTRRLSMLSTPGVEGVYQTAYRDCAYNGNRIPPAVAVQQLVAALAESQHPHEALEKAKAQLAPLEKTAMEKGEAVAGLMAQYQEQTGTGTPATSSRRTRKRGPNKQ